MASCLNEPDCIITSTNLVKINFKVNSKTARVVNFTKITVSGLEKDFYVEAQLSSVQLPVEPEANESTFTFYFENRIETIHLTYTRQAEVISANCGAYTNYAGLAIPESTFELFNITNKELLIDATSNIEVFIE